MISRSIILGVGLALTCAGLAAAQSRNETVQPPWAIPSDADIQKILVKRIDTQKRSVGLVVGIIDPKGRRIISYGALDQGDARPLNGDTVFEIGSITKVFTSLILADMVQHQEVELDDPAAKYLPAGVKMPVRGAGEITLLDLATHSSGLPRMPDNFTPKDPENPFADYTVNQLYHFLNGHALPREPGEKFEYSNLGVGLLGHLLGLKAGMDYETLVHKRITEPLGMKDTAVTPSPDMKARLAVGHDAALKAVKNWEVRTLSGAGALYSTANDLLTFLAAELGSENSALKASMVKQLSVRRPAGAASTAIALGWIISSDPKGTAIWHNGGTGGYRSFMGFNPATKTGVVLLSNVSPGETPDDIGFHLLTGRPLANILPPTLHTEIALDAKAKQAFVGQYQLAPNSILTISLQDDQILARPTGQETFVMHAESPTQLFCKCAAEAQIKFIMDANGRAERIVVSMRGKDIPAKRIQ